MAGIINVMAGTLADAADECSEVADLLREIRGALHRSIKAPEEDLRENVCYAVRELDAMLAGDGGQAVAEEEGVQNQVNRVSVAIRVALPEILGILSQGRLEPTVACEVRNDLVSFLEAFLPQLRECLPHPRD
jgi:hypothetical protein